MNTATSSGVSNGNIAEESVFGINYRDRLRIVSLTTDYRLRDDWQGTTYATLGRWSTPSTRPRPAPSRTN